MNKKDIFENISIVLKPSEYEDLNNLVSNLVRWLKRRGKEVSVLEKERSRLEKVVQSSTFKQLLFKNEKEIYKNSDLLISLGGDGTLLGVCRKISPNIPIFGVNLGRLGFITEFSKSDFYEKLNIVLSGKFQTKKQQIFKVSVHDKKEEIDKQYFINDIVFNKKEIARMITLNVSSEEQHIYNLSGDGLIISSTVGSTAYSLAAGGAIVHPSVNALLLTPVCPHSLTHRPLVISDNSSIEVQVVDSKENAAITVDGQKVLEFNHKHTVKVTKESRKKITLILNDERSFYHTLKEKFVHGRSQF